MGDPSCWLSVEGEAKKETGHSLFTCRAFYIIDKYTQNCFMATGQKKLLLEPKALLAL